MRHVSLAIVFSLVTVAHARPDGYYLTESFGGMGFNGGLAKFGDGAPRIQLGFAMREGDLGFELLAGAAVPSMFFIDCYGDECMSAPANGELWWFGADARRSWPLVRTRWARLDVRAVVHAGPRWYMGEAEFAGHAGPGVSAGGGIEGNAWVLGYFLDAGLDAVWLRHGDANVVGTAPYLVLGAKVGWL